MKFSAPLILLSLALAASAAPRRFDPGFHGGSHFPSNFGGTSAAPSVAATSSVVDTSTAAASSIVNTSAAAPSVVDTSTSSAAAASSVAVTATVVSTAAAASATAAAGNSAANGTAVGNEDPQQSLTLLQSVLATGFEQNGNEVPAVGQEASITSSNNFINFCATVPGKVITNGTQVKEGSCNPAPMGVIAAQTNMPSAKFVFPSNGDASLKANTTFTIRLAIKNLETGHFVNAATNYFAAPQQVNAQGNIKGHSHVVIESLPALNSTLPTDPSTNAFFKGLNEQAVNGVLSVEVTGGLPAGFYRLASINSAANHQPVLVAVAQHGALDDMVYFTINP